MDLATILGIVSAFGLILFAIISGSGLSAFIDIPSLAIVAGGTLGTGLINYPLKEMIGSINVVRHAFFHTAQTPGLWIPKFVEFSTTARRDGILALPNVVTDLDNTFLAKGIQLIIDGMEPKAIENILETELEFQKNRHKLGAELFQTLGGFAPAMGLIGTLVGLVQMLQSLDDPSTIGPAMAVALLTTFYGAIFANIILLPIAGKLRTRSSEEQMASELMVEGILSIAAGDNPRIVEQKLHAFLAPLLRESAYEA